MKVRLKIDSFSADLLRQFFSQVNAPIVKGMELEHLILINFDHKNHLKLHYPAPQGYKLNILLHEAVSLHRMLFRISLTDPILEFTRNELCSTIEKSLPTNTNNFLQHG